MADFQRTFGTLAPATATVTKAGDPGTLVEVDSISWVSDTVILGIEGPTNELTAQVRASAFGVGTLTFNARRVSDGLMISKSVTIEVVEPPEPAPDIVITMGVEA